MDKKSLLGVVLITLIVFGFTLYNSFYTQQEIAKLPQQTTKIAAETPDSRAMPSTQNRITQNGQEGALFLPLLQGQQRLIVVENEVSRVTLSSKGVSPLQWTLKEYKAWGGEPVQMISDESSRGELGSSFLLHDGSLIDTRDLYFEIQGNLPDTLRLAQADSAVIRGVARTSDGREIVRQWTFYGGGRYDSRLEQSMQRMEDIVKNRRLTIAWQGGLRYQEKKSKDESSHTSAQFSQAGSVETLDASDTEAEAQTANASGAVEYSALKTKYFLAAMQPLSASDDDKLTLTGVARKAPNDGVIEQYSMSWSSLIANKPVAYRIIVAPLDYDQLKAYSLEGTIDFGFRWIVRPIGEYFMLPLFNLVHSVVPNYGVVIIIFAVLIKLLLWPLTTPQMKSAAKMQLLAPELEKIRSKYADDMAMQQRKTMELYSEYGVNPAGGCLPLLLQMPILYALWAVFSASIALRQSSFLWIPDLSLPDVLVELPFTVPLFGVNIVSGLALAMATTMFVQQKISVTDPRQKGLIFIMPVLFLLIFSNFPAGLNLYYFVFNILGIAHQLYTTKFSKNKLTLEDLKKMPKKESWLQKKMKEAQQIAEAQGKVMPGQQPPKKKK